MAKAGYSIPTGAAVALSAAATRSVLGVRAGSTFGLDLTKVRYGFDGVTASLAPIVVELCYATFAANPPSAGGSVNTTITTAVQQRYGRAIAHGVTAARAWTSGNEPTVLSVLEEEYLTPNGGQLWYDMPLGTSDDCAPDHGFVLRMTTGAGVTANARAVFVWERC